MKTSLLSMLGMLLLGNFAGAQSAPTVDCDLKTLTQFCEKLKSKEKTQLRSKIPHRFSNGETMPSVDSITGDSLPMNESGTAPIIEWGKMQRLQKIFAQTVKYSQDAILQGRALNELSDEEKNLLTRIKTMKLSDFSNPQDRSTCHDGYLFGYNSRPHSLVMCPVMADYPTSGIVWAMGAFIGRGLGNCMTGAMWYRDAKNNIVFDKFPPEKHPFNMGPKSLRSCLMAGGFPDPVNSIDFSKPDLKKLLDTEITASHRNKKSDLPVRSEKLSDALKDDKNIEWGKKLVTDHRECLPGQTGSRVDSGIQDWFGAEVAGRYLEDHPLNAQTEEDNLQPIAPMVDYICRYPMAADLTVTTHAPLETRFESAIFGNERLRQAMNCSPKVPAKKICTFSAPEATDKIETPKDSGSKSDGMAR